jgi:hypothetical protein
MKVRGLPARFHWTLHNLLGHPLSEILFQLGLKRLAEKVHDGTTPEEQ